MAMQPIAALAKRAEQNATRGCSEKPKSEPPPPTMPQAWVDALMAKLGCIWGAKWQSHVDACGGLAAVAEEWRQGIEGMSGEQIKRALEYCRLNSAWPPSIAEFRAAAGDGSNAEQRAFQARQRAEDDATNALPAETWAEQRERGKAHLKALKATFRSANTPSEDAEATPGFSPNRG